MLPVDKEEAIFIDPMMAEEPIFIWGLKEAVGSTEDGIVHKGITVGKFMRVVTALHRRWVESMDKVKGIVGTWLVVDGKVVRTVTFFSLSNT